MLLNFQPRFAAMILAGTKRHTIRAKRKIRPRVGEICHCYTGLRQRGPIIQKLASGQVIRQKMSRLLGRWPCVKVQDIMIDTHPISGHGMVLLDFQELDLDERERLAISDGFECFADMLAFWKGRLPFVGDMIHWNPESVPTRSQKGADASRTDPKDKGGL